MTFPPCTPEPEEVQVGFVEPAEYVKPEPAPREDTDLLPKSTPEQLLNVASDEINRLIEEKNAIFAEKQDAVNLAAAFQREAEELRRQNEDRQQRLDEQVVARHEAEAALCRCYALFAALHRIQHPLRAKGSNEQQALADSMQEQNIAVLGMEYLEGVLPGIAKQPKWC